MKKKCLPILQLIMLSWLMIGHSLFAQSDSVDVQFFYRPEGNPFIVYLPGEFNNWANNVNGTISDGRFAMSKDQASGTWSRTIRLRVGGPNPLPNPSTGIPGAYQYKFNENGSSTGWLSDPLNPRQNGRDFNNSYLFIKDPTIHYLLPNSVSGIVRVSQPEISAYIFPAVSSSVVADSIKVILDGTVYGDLGPLYDTTAKLLTFVPPEPLSSGTHKLKLMARSSLGTVTEDSTTFIVQAGFLQLLTRSNDRYLRPSITIVGQIEDSAMPVNIVQNGTDTVAVAANEEGRFEFTASLSEGENTFSAFSFDASQQLHETSAISINYFIDHTPRPTIAMIRTSESAITLIVDANDPDGDEVSVSWTSDDERNPEPLGLHSQSNSVDVTLPQTRGDYFVYVTAADPAGNVGMARAFFTIESADSVSLSSVNANPSWVRDAIIYEIYVPAFTAQGTFSAMQGRLANIEALGANVIWLMPIYENGGVINELNAGYNITDFFQVHPQLGTMAEFQSFSSAAQSMGMRVILDSTPNHVSESHEWVNDVKLFGEFSNFRPVLETRILGDNRGLGQSAVSVGGEVLYVRYSDWTLPNLNYSNIETVDFMMDVYKFWVLEQGIDGYRMDVYWGPHNRYGKSAWWRPFRQEIKRVQPDILILGETDGTGPGSENNFADFGGASDAAYDWNFYGEVRSTLNGGSISNLDNRVRNFSPSLLYNTFTGPNSHYLRFLENHDEPRIASLHSSDFERTNAGAALLFTIPGVPLIYAGQEVGETSRRGKINWNRTNAQDTFAFYQRLTAIRNTFETFRSSEIKRLNATGSRVYAYLRPRQDENGMGIVNFSSSSVSTTVTVDETDLRLTTPLNEGVTYYLNDVLNDTSYEVTKSSLANFSVELPAWGSAAFVLADSIINLVTSVDFATGPTLPERFSLLQNYPNPFNPSTVITFALAKRSDVTLDIYNVIGQKVRTLVSESRPAGSHRIEWDGRNDFGLEIGSGVYLVMMRARPVDERPYVQSIKLVKLK